MRVFMVSTGAVLLSLLFIYSSFSQTPSGKNDGTQANPQVMPPTKADQQGPLPQKTESKMSNTAEQKPADAKTEEETIDQQPGVPEENPAAATPVDEKQPSVQQQPSDRPWIIKMEKQPGMPVKKPVFDWTSEYQQRRCEALLGQLIENFRYAKHFSIVGDGCNTAGYAERFMTVKTACEKECPAGFLEKNGYNETIVRNIDTLHELGTKRCLGGRPMQKVDE